MAVKFIEQVPNFEERMNKKAANARASAKVLEEMLLRHKAVLNDWSTHDLGDLHDADQFFKRVDKLIEEEVGPQI